MISALSLCSALVGRHQSARGAFRKTSQPRPSSISKTKSPARLGSTKSVYISSSSKLVHRAQLERSRPGSILVLVRRSYASSYGESEQLQLEGKTDGTISRLWSKYKMYAIGAGGAVAAVSLIGVTASVLAVGGLVSIAGGVYAWYRNRVRHQQSVLRVLIEPILDEKRKQIESFIGPFEYPERSEVAADSATQKTPTGDVETVVRNVFYLDGKYGKAFVRAMAVQDDDTGEHALRKLVVDVQDFRRTTGDKLVLVDAPPVLDCVDAVSYRGYTLREFIDIKKAAYEQKYASSKPSPGTTSNKTQQQQQRTTKAKRSL